MEHQLALELASRFSLVPNRLDYCGPEGAYLSLSAFLDHGYFNVKNISDLLERFEAPIAYYDCIGKIHNHQSFSLPVVEAYWLGNELLKVPVEALSYILDRISRRGLPKALAMRLKDKLKPGMMPHHSFQVFFVGVGAMTQSVEPRLENLNACLIRPGRVKSITLTHLTVALPFFNRDGSIKEVESKEVRYQPEWFTALEVGSLVAAHWDSACLSMTEEEASRLITVTRQNLLLFKD